MNSTEIENILNPSLVKFIANDKKELLENNVFEVTLSSRIAMYLQVEFCDYNVDCEYNKFLSDQKVNENGKRIRPDIIVHVRNSASQNLLLLEVKKCGKNSNRFKNDIDKIRNCSNLNYITYGVVGLRKKGVDVFLLTEDDERTYSISNDAKINNLVINSRFQ